MHHLRERYARSQPTYHESIGSDVHEGQVGEDSVDDAAPASTAVTDVSVGSLD